MNERKRDKVIETLRQSRKRIAGRSSWCRFTQAVTASERAVGPKDARAVAWCAVGSVRAESPSDAVAQLCIAYLEDALPRGCAERSVAGFNDAQSTNRPVLRLFDRAIKRLESEQ